MRVLVINLGSTSTKVALYENKRFVMESNIRLDSRRLCGFGSIPEQYDYRLETLTEFMEKNGIEPALLDAVVTRGGHSEPITGGVYRITPKMLEQSKSMRYGYHPSDLGLLIADEFRSRYGCEAFTVDPPVTSEFEPYAFYSGMPEIQRVSAFHVLNHRAVGMEYAKEHGKAYSDICLVVVHMGGGISVAAHKYGKLVDANNALFGDGPFSTDRTGGLPVGPLIDLCFSGKYNYQQMRRKINGEGGLMGYLGENDLKVVCGQAEAGDERSREVLGAMCYQTAKEVGACAAVLRGKAEAIILTGGMAFSDYLVEQIASYVSFLAPVVRYPGEYEMFALAHGAYNALEGKVDIKELE